jgi:hypothetical protein
MPSVATATQSRMPERNGVGAAAGQQDAHRQAVAAVHGAHLVAPLARGDGRAEETEDQGGTPQRDDSHPQKEDRDGDYEQRHHARSLPRAYRRPTPSLYFR